MPSKNKEKYGSFSDYIMHSPEVFKGLFVTSQWIPIPIFGFILYTLLFYQQYEVALIIIVIFSLFIRRLYRFYKNGGMKNLPDEMTGYKFLWER